MNDRTMNTPETWSLKCHRAFILAPSSFDIRKYSASLPLQKGGMMIVWALAIAIVGCGYPESAKVADSDSSGRSIQSSSKTDDATASDTKNNDNSNNLKQQSEDQASGAKSDARQDAATNKPLERKQSPIDRALDNLKKQPVQEGTKKPAQVRPIEVHPDIQPLVEKTWTRLHPGFEVWLDMKNKQVIVGGRICFREGPLEMFACPENTKEHESIVSTKSNGEIIHAGLLAVGAKVGKVVQWEPDYVPASGSVVKVTAVWNQDGDVKRVKAQEMIRDITTGEALAHDWVFCGSGTWKDPDSGREEYFANSGDLICVSNFSTAMMDLTVESSDINDGLRFHAWTENIPPLGTPVLLILKPDQTSEESISEEEREALKDNKKDDG